MMFHSELIQIGDGRRLMKKPFGISSGPTSFGHKINNKSYNQIDCDIFVTLTTFTQDDCGSQAQSESNSENGSVAVKCKEILHFEM